MYRLLIADDETIERKVLCKTLKKCMGDVCEIFEAKNGKEAVDIFKTEKVQIAILDIEMPGMNGLEAARQMRSYKKDCVLLFLTAYNEFSYAKQAITVQALDYLLKPYEEKELVYTVEEAFRLVDKNERICSLGIFEEQEEFEKITIEEVRLSVMKEQIEEYVKKHYVEELSIHQLSEMMNYSEAYFSRLFKQCFRSNFTSYLIGYRMEVAKELLENSGMSVKEAGKACGYENSNYFSRIFKRVTGVTPTAYRNLILIRKRC